MGNCIFLRRGAPPSSGPTPGKTLNEYSWEEISYISSNGLAGEYGFQVGDEKNITLSTNEALTLAIMDFDHDDLADGTGKAGITFGLKNLMAETRGMNSVSNNRGGFTGSAMYTWLQGDLLNSLPADLQTVLKSVNKKTSAGYQSSTINTDPMKIFLFAEIEIFGAVTESVAGEGSQYNYFANAANRTKYLSNGSGSASKWWGRSPCKGSRTSFCIINSYGGVNSASAGQIHGICFAFCV